MYRDINRNICRDPVTAAVIIGGVATAGATAYSAREERKGAEKAAETQAQVAREQLQAQKDSESMAQETAKKQLKAAQARKTSTILTTPLGASVEEGQTNQPGILGVPN